MNKKGFTLVEILAIIVVLGIIVMLVLPQISGSMDSKKEKEYEKIKETVESAAKVYHSSNQDIYRINLETLVNDRYLTTDLTNPVNGSKMTGCVRVFIDEDGIYEYSYADSCGTKNIPFDVDLGGGKANQTFESSYLDGTIIELKDATLNGFDFSHWEVVKGNSYVHKGKLIIGDTDTILKAMWISWPTLTMDYAGGTPTQVLEEKYQSGETITLTNPVRTGYTFEGWTVTSGNGVVSGSNFTMGSVDTIVKAKWIANPYTVTFNADGGTVTPSSKEVAYEGAYGNLPTPEKPGYTFNGWYIGDTQITESSIMNVVGGTTLKAKWSTNTYMINYVLNGGTKGTNSPESGIYDSVLTIDNPTRLGYTFAGWTVTSGLNTSTAKYGTSSTDVTSPISSSSTKVTATYFKNLTTTVSGSVTLTANWTATTYTITYALNSGTKGTNAPASGTYDSVLTIDNPTRAGYEFTGWTVTSGLNASTAKYGTSSTNVTSSISSSSTKITEKYFKNLATTGSVTLTANWTAATYTITFNTDGGTAVTPTSKQVTYGGKYGTLPETTKNAYKFLGWYIGNTQITADSTVSITSDTQLTAKWLVLNPIEAYYCTNTSTDTSAYALYYTGKCSVVNEGSGKWNIMFTSSGTLTVASELTIDVFLVGGGGNGGANSSFADNLYGTGMNYSGGRGGYGAYTTTQKKLTLAAGTYTITVASAQGTTSAFSLSAAGATASSGKRSGGGGCYGGYYVSGGGIGTCSAGSGSNGEYAFGESGFKHALGAGYMFAASGGGGGGYVAGYSGRYGRAGSGGASGGGAGAQQDGTGAKGADNSGSGGGGAGGGSGKPGAGGTGAVIIRSAR